MKKNVIVWKSPRGNTSLVSWEIGSSSLTIHAFQIDAEHTKSVVAALKEATDLMSQCEEMLYPLQPAQQSKQITASQTCQTT